MPVLVSEVLEGLAPVTGGVYVDGTVGLGGHAEALLRHPAGVGRVIGLDRDASALDLAAARLAPFADRLTLVHNTFAALPDVLAVQGLKGVHGILLDLGISSHQLEHSGRGFAFSRDEPLDMRMDESEGITAAEMVNRLPAEGLAEVIRVYGEERWARRIAAAIVRARQKTPIRTSAELAGVVTSAIPARYRTRRIHPATRTFQALRIAVNRELDALKEALDVLPSCLLPGGRLCVISFHSLEDRMVKHAFREDVRLAVITRRPVTPSTAEVAVNPRARSAKLRVAARRDAAGRRGRAAGAPADIPGRGRQGGRS
ncbi:16S rRNA (cytosine(1402)-N(4))-methyltransferase RsmH [Dissulfurirhabdus thermomarina]|uniref:16S rRNA (cytosine(1402)-N(4))-methyltransferase RsmH n=1 Tax=Dissulfurirhabdus thermomarina TaxID=1765737 RepID=UPI002852EAEB|nr:16S rRNA (cytosine(1402)-N(4))-methyltransferase RsmH [Dissulfurirhabdus thermomarina]